MLTIQTASEVEWASWVLRKMLEIALMLALALRLAMPRDSPGGKTAHRVSFPQSHHHRVGSPPCYTHGPLPRPQHPLTLGDLQRLMPDPQTRPRGSVESSLVQDPFGNEVKGGGGG